VHKICFLGIVIVVCEFFWLVPSRVNPTNDDPFHFLLGADIYRKRRVYREEIDPVIEANLDEIVKLYDKYSSTKIAPMFIPKAISFKKMTLDEFLELLDDRSILDQTLSQREAKICYIGSLPMMEQISITPQYSMSLFDFIEALIRAANIIYDSLVERDDDNTIIPMLRPMREEDPEMGAEEMESVANIMVHFINDLVNPTYSKNASGAESEDEGDGHAAGAGGGHGEKNEEQINDSGGTTGGRQRGESYDDVAELGVKTTPETNLLKERKLQKRGSTFGMKNLDDGDRSGSGSGSSKSSSRGNSRGGNSSGGNSRGNSRGGNSRERRRNSKAARANQKTYASKDHGGSSVDIMSAISKLESLGGGI